MINKMDPKVLYWFDLAEYDMVTAEAMFDTKRYLYVGFMCHQITEKLLKAYFVKTTNINPPFTHNLRVLAESSGLFNIMDNDQINYLAELLPLNIEARYPTYKEILLKQLTEEKCLELISQTKDFFSWIKQKL